LLISGSEPEQGLEKVDRATFMRIAVTISVYNEEHNIAHLLDCLLRQTHLPDEIVIVDDGSSDRTAELIGDYAKQHSFIHYVYQENAGIAVARNKAWKNTTADICVFTDGDCSPDTTWIEQLLGPFEDERVGATAGTYRTINTESLLARFIGMEISWKYRNVSGEIDAHGTYNLAVKRTVLEEMQGFNEKFNVSGEDWDLTCRISAKYKIIFVPQAVVGHYHPEKIWSYLKNQMQRGSDRIRLYREHPEIVKGDSYTPQYIKYQVLAAGVLVPSLLLFYPFFRFSFLVPIFLSLFLFGTFCIPFPYYVKRDMAVALFCIPLQCARSLAWFTGLVKAFATMR